MAGGSVLPYSDAELVLGLVAPAGTNLDRVTSSLEANLLEFRYEANIVRFSQLAEEMTPRAAPATGSAEFRRLMSLMDAGDEVRRQGEGDALALVAAGSIARRRT